MQKIKTIPITIAKKKFALPMQKIKRITFPMPKKRNCIANAKNKKYFFKNCIADADADAKIKKNLHSQLPKVKRNCIHTKLKS